MLLVYRIKPKMENINDIDLADDVILQTLSTRMRFMTWVILTTLIFMINKICENK